MEYWLYIFLALVTIPMIWHLFYHRSSTTSNKNNPSAAAEKQHKTYNAVSIHAPSGSCEAINCFKRKRILVTEAPALPVMGCNAEKCACSFIRHRDRRNEEDRRAPSITWDSAQIEKNNRNKRDRRRLNFA